MPGDHGHVREAEREPELLGGLRARPRTRPSGSQSPKSSSAPEGAVGGDDEEQADDGEAAPPAAAGSKTTNRSAPSPVIAARHRGHWPRAPRIGAVIDREQVLHVARLARLELTEAGDRADGRRALGDPRARRPDLLRSTSTRSSRPRTWSRSRTCCAPTSPRPSLPRERALEQAPDAADGAFRVPSPQA